MDIYDKAIAYLTSNPSQIIEVWDDPKSHYSGVLFRCVTPSGYPEDSPDGFRCGELCAIRSFDSHAWTEELEEEINQDHRIPKLWANNDFIPKLTVNHLAVFAEWQRKIDTILDRDPNQFIAVE
jgi:hypothetical protein